METIFSARALVTNTLSHRRSCCVWRCSKDIQSYNAFWITLRCCRSLLLLCVPRLHDAREQLRYRFYLARQFLRYRWFDHLVRYRSDISQVLRGIESAGHRQENVPICPQNAAICRMVVCLWIRAHTHRGCFFILACHD